MLTYGVMLLHDSALPHMSTAPRIRSLLEHFNRELFYYPPYITDFAPSYCNFFTNLKNWLQSQRFKNNEVLMQGVKTWLSSQAADFFDTLTHSWS
jgi:hypothetical protein